jgi:polyhydroxyalkanoate synthesis regulator phasin
MDELKKVLLAGIGLTSMTLEKANAFVKELVEKGRLTVEEGKELQSELKRKGEDEAKELLDQLDVKTKTVQYATKEDVSRLEDKLDALLKQSASDDKE